MQENSCFSVILTDLHIPINFSIMMMRLKSYYKEQFKAFVYRVATSQLKLNLYFQKPSKLFPKSCNQKNMKLLLNWYLFRVLRQFINLWRNARKKLDEIVLLVNNVKLIESILYRHNLNFVILLLLIYK